MTQEEETKEKRFAYWQLSGMMGDPKETAQTERTGGFTKLPDITALKDANMVGKPLLGAGLPTFVEAYIDWASMSPEEHFPPQRELENWINRGRLHLGNIIEETKQLLKWMQENPLAVADYLDTIWVPEYSKLATEPFRKLAKQNKLWQFNL